MTQTDSTYRPGPWLAVRVSQALAELRGRWPRTFNWAGETSDFAMAKHREWAHALQQRNVTLEAIPAAARRWMAINPASPPKDASEFARFAEQLDVDEFRTKDRVDVPKPAPAPAMMVANRDPYAAVRERLNQRFGEARPRQERDGTPFHNAFFGHVMRLAAPADMGANGRPVISDALYEAAARCATYDGIVAGLLGSWRRVDGFWDWWGAQVSREFAERIQERHVSDDEIRAAVRTYQEAQVAA